MLKGTTVSLRPVAEADLEELQVKLIDIEARGPWYPMPQTSLTRRRKAFEDAGFWTQDEGIFVMVDEQDRLIGTVDLYQAKRGCARHRNSSGRGHRARPGIT